MKPVYNVVFLLQSLGSLVKYVTCCGFLCTFIWFVMHVASRLDALSLSIKNAIDQLDHQLLGKLIKEHLHLWR